MSTPDRGTNSPSRGTATLLLFFYRYQMPYAASLDQIEELRSLLTEYDAAIQVTCDPDEKWRLYRNLQELRSCIEHLRQIRG